MKEPMTIHTGLCITDDHIVGITAHIENKTMVITDAMEMERQGPIGEDFIRYIKNYDLEEGFFSIVVDMKTEMTMAPFDPHDFDVKEFIKWNIEDVFSFDECDIELDACKREYPRHHYHLFLVGVDHHELELLWQGIIKTCAPVDCIDCWPIPVTYGLMQRSGTITGIREQTGMHLWAWWNDACVHESMVPCHGGAISKALLEMEEKLQDYGVDEIQGIHFYDVQDESEEVRIDLQALEEVYGGIEYIPMVFLGRGKTKCKLGDLHWDMALGMAARGLNWIGHGW